MLKKEIMLIVLLLIDGLGYNYLKPESFWKRHSIKIQNAVPTITAPNWSTILSCLDPKDHGVFDNKSHGLPSYKFPHSTIFNDKKSCLLISDWKMMEKFSDRCDFLYQNVWSNLFQTVNVNKKKYDLIVLNYSRLDTVAHLLGWGAKPYEKTMKNIEKKTELLYEMLQQQGEKFVLMGVADHGGFQDDHEESHLKDVRDVPFLWLTNDDRLRRPRIKKTQDIRRVIQSL